ncbi:MAG: tryptophan-rich sensory protein [Clostridiales bacterium]|nr:tryptophan-rich sensory protein [Clostridiales bacterium]
MNNIFKVKGKCKIIQLIRSIFISSAILSLTYLFIKNSINTYNELIKPFFIPPFIILSIITVVLYIIWGFSSYRIFMVGKTGNNIKDSLFYYYLQLLLNFLWYFVFFVFRLYGISFILMFIIFIIVFICFLKFYKYDKLSGRLFSINIIWTLFLCYTNFCIWMNNEM